MLSRIKDSYGTVFNRKVVGSKTILHIFWESSGRIFPPTLSFFCWQKQATESQYGTIVFHPKLLFLVSSARASNSPSGKFTSAEASKTTAENDEDGHQPPLLRPE